MQGRRWLAFPPVPEALGAHSQPPVGSPPSPTNFCHPALTRRAWANGPFWKPRTRPLWGSCSFSCPCETPQLCGQRSWQQWYRASSYRPRALVPTPDVSALQALAPRCCARPPAPSPAPQLRPQAAAPPSRLQFRPGRGPAP